jgi:hypothetical protein
MTFLQPWLLLALPIVALPVIIHLVNQWRFQSVEWAAMRFLLAAKALSRGYSRLRQWLILALRMLAVAAAVFAVSRPLSRGWLASLGGDEAAAIVLLDRSPSMTQAAVAGGESKLATARRQVVSALETLGTKRVILIDSVTGSPLELASPRALAALPETEPTAAPADLPKMLQAACAQLRADTAAAGSIWICSDERVNDWKPADGAWPAIRAEIAAIPQGVRVNLLAATDPGEDNLAVRVTKATLEPRGKGWELLLDLALRRQRDQGPVRVPVTVELGGARSTIEIELAGTEAVLSRHAIPVDPAALASGDGEPSDLARASGWGRVTIPADVNPADNEAYFTFGKAPTRRTVIVAEDPRARDALELVVGIPPDKLLTAAVDVVAPAEAAGMALDEAALLLWQAPIPEGETLAIVERFVDRGGDVVFLPPESPNAASFAGVGWGAWSEHSPPLRPASWRSDEGWLAGTLTGAALPVGELEIRRVCAVTGPGTDLATLPEDLPLLRRAPRDRGAVAFLATTPSPRDSDLATNGIVLYCLLQRAIDDGLAAVGPARMADAGEFAGPGARETPLNEGWRQIAGPPSPSTESGFHAGVLASRGRLVAINRPPREDCSPVLAGDQVDALFQGLSWSRFEQQAGGLGSLVEEVWRPCLMALLLALAAEGLLSLPHRPMVVGARAAREAIP